jgi:hypothetical protein
MKSAYCNFRVAIHRTLKVANKTTETELAGIKIAATSGERIDKTAKLKPMIL